MVFRADAAESAGLPALGGRYLESVGHAWIVGPGRRPSEYGRFQSTRAVRLPMGKSGGCRLSDAKKRHAARIWPAEGRMLQGGVAIAHDDGGHGWMGQPGQGSDAHAPLFGASLG